MRSPGAPAYCPKVLQLFIWRYPKGCWGFQSSVHGSLGAILHVLSEQGSWKTVFSMELSIGPAAWKYLSLQQLTCTFNFLSCLWMHLDVELL